MSQIIRSELLSAPRLTPEAEARIQELLQTLQVIGIGVSVEGKAVEGRREYRLKLPDAIIAATAEVLGCPLVTADQELVRKLASRLEVVNTTTVLSSGQVSDRPETLDRKVSKGCESTGFEETCRSGERRGQETLAEHVRKLASRLEVVNPYAPDAP